MMRIRTRETPSASFETLSRLAGIAREAGRTVMTFYGRPSGVEQKGSLGPVTDADRASHRIIVDALRNWDRTVPIVSEEDGVADYATRCRWTRFWLVDPLDGTKEFLNGDNDFTVNIALIERDQPVAGVVFAPAADIIYVAARGLGAWRHVGVGPAERLQSAPPRPGQALRVVESRSHRSEALDRFLETLPVAERVPVGSSLKFCRVAEGRADLYARMSPIMEWDTAAGDCIYRYSGAGAERPSPLRYNGPELRFPQFVIGVDASYLVQKVAS